MMENNPETGTVSQQRRRLKIANACDTCRVKKVKCDGIRPACGYCSKKLGLRDSCRYKDVSRPSSGPNRIAKPRSAGTVRINIVPRPKRVLESEEPAHEQVAFKHVVPAESRSFESQDQAIPNNVEGGSFNGRDLDTIDSMNAVVDDEADTEQFFGSSSAGSFTRQIKKAIDAWMGEERQGSINAKGRKAVGNPDPFVTPSRSLATADASYTLPPRRQADYLMETYWTNVYPLYPFLDVQSWKASYEALYAGTMNEKHEQLFMATTNVIFAISAQLIESTSIDERDTASNTFFQRAQSLVKFHPCDSGSVELVQNLLLTSQYLQSTSKPQQTWMVTGSAIRIAQSIGLHLPETSSRASNVRQKELLRRLWYGCVLMDRMVSMTHGRPAMISKHSASIVTLPFGGSNQQIVANDESSEATRVMFFVQSVKLYEIIHQIVHAFYSDKAPSENGKGSGSNSPGSEIENLEVLMSLEKSLVKWEKKLPGYLRISHLDQSVDPINKRQTVILHLRALHARILLLRPTFYYFCLPSTSCEPDDPTIDTLQDRLIKQSALLCVSTAQRVVGILNQYQGVDGNIGLLPAWWYRLYYLFTAAAILITARLRPEIFDVTDIADSWTQAMSLLRKHEMFGSSACRCVAALHILSSKMTEAVPAGAIFPKGQWETDSSVTDGHTEVSPQHYERINACRSVQQGGTNEREAFSSIDLDGIDLAELDFNLSDLSWFNDVHAAWDIINFG